MGIQDRDYYRDDPRQNLALGRSVGGMRMWSVTTWLIVLCVGVFVIDALLLRSNVGYARVLIPTDRGLVEGIVNARQFRELSSSNVPYRVIDTMGPMDRWGFFSVDSAIAGLQVWRWITFQFLHANLGHLFGNMLGLYFFGPMIEAYLGRRRFLAFYLLCGIAGPVLYLAFALTGLLGTSLSTPLVGASAGIFGILIAAAQIAPRTTVMLMFPPIPMQLRTLAWVLLGIAAFTVFTQGRNAGGEAAHLGGAALGWILIYRPHLLRWAETLTGGAGESRGVMRYRGWR